MPSGVEKEAIFAMQAHQPAEPFILDMPDMPRVPFIYNSPHSGRCYPPAFLVDSAVKGEEIRRSEDCYIDLLFETASLQGAPFLQATYPRAYLDTNREAYELDPNMFLDDLPPYVNCLSARVQAGLGTVPRLISPGKSIYHKKLTFTEAEDRLRRIYFPYHHRLRSLLDNTHHQFGYAILIDCHSFPRQNTGELQHVAGEEVDIVLGDSLGHSCMPEITGLAEAIFRDMGYRVRRNIPYAGGNNLLLYGSPAKGYHALQIEIRRGLYMNEATFQRVAGFETLKDNLKGWMDKLHRSVGSFMLAERRGDFSCSSAAE